MSAPKCSRLWTVEAIRDGRVKGSEREGFERHLPNCPDCLEESKLLDELARRLREMPVAQLDVLSVRRQRQRLMADSDASRMKQARSPSSRRLGYAIAISASVGLVFGWSRWLRHDALPIEGAMAEPIIDVRPEQGSRWHRTRNGTTNGVELDEGTISLRIQRRATAGRIVIIVPDGEIEDFGTVLRVRVARERTAEVRVEEGNVAIRVRGVPERRLGPGESWAPEQVPAIDPAQQNAASAPIVQSPPGPAPGDLPAAPAKSSRGVIGASPRARSEGRSEGRVEVDAGTSSESHDAEDVAYLQIVKLARDGKTSEARSQAREYLLRFPNGFRRVEMLDIATGRSEDR